MSRAWCLLLLTACSPPLTASPSEPVRDAGAQPEDAGPTDAGASALDAGVVDAGTPPDASIVTPDAGPDLITERDLVDPACPDDDAEITAFTFPPGLDTNTLRTARVTVRNTGTTTWSEADEYRLGSPGNTDPFADNARFSLPGGHRVAPGQQFTFELDLRAPTAAGAYVTDWKMVKEHTCWFGDRITVPIGVRAPVPTGQCLDPAPRGLDQMAAVVHIVGPTRTTLDSTPKVCDRRYCAEIGFTDGRTCCPPRPEGHPDVEPCNEAIVGRASDTGRIGPTWTFDGQLCDPHGPGNCRMHPDNQFLLLVFGPGTARACGNLNGVCGTVVVP